MSDDSRRGPDVAEDGQPPAELTEDVALAAFNEMSEGQADGPYPDGFPSQPDPEIGNW
jgi:hypothetical protein